MVSAADYRRDTESEPPARTKSILFGGQQNPEFLQHFLKKIQQIIKNSQT